ncbi:5-formyltetrahydrofolate cyclo-ligase [Spiribacter sp. 218]|uniref:5-formyltetrahydrofolate cyclo-ligase n=1 Tax=Spiribacter pallidus TaxID=1987936 RepID=UPI00349F5CDF
MTLEDKPGLRGWLRQRRRAISPVDQHRAAQAAAERLSALARWRHAKRVAIYLPADGEMGTAAVMDAAWQAGKAIYLPVIQPPRGQHGAAAARRAGHLVFRRYQPRTPLRPGLLGIPEPVRGAAPCLPLAALDVLVMPLVGFDARGRRLGMGGGFYDRTLAGRNGHRRPWRVGLAHAIQQIPALPEDPWDQRLDACVTESSTWLW